LKTVPSLEFEFPGRRRGWFEFFGGGFKINYRNETFVTPMMTASTIIRQAVAISYRSHSNQYRWPFTMEEFPILIRWICQ